MSTPDPQRSALIGGPTRGQIRPWRQIQALVRKDLRRELRTREVTTTTVAFSVMLMVIFTFAFYTNDETVRLVFPGILWVSIVFTGTLAIGRTFAQEKDAGCLRALALVPGTPLTLYTSKLLINLLFVGLFEIVLVPLVALAFDVALLPRALEYTALLVSGTIGFAAVGTLVAAMLVHNHLRDVMLPILLYPLVIPLIIAGVKVTGMLLDGADPEQVWRWIRIIAAIDVVFLVISQLLFRWVLSAIE